MLYVRWWIGSRVLNRPFELDLGQFCMKFWPEGSIAEPLFNDQFESSDRRFVPA
jgi:hypothetical protein